MRTAHITTPDGTCLHSYCGLSGDGGTIVMSWDYMPPGHRACLRCVRKINRLRINAKVPAYMIPKAT